MTLELSTRTAESVATLSKAIWDALTRAGETDLAIEAAALNGRDAQEYLSAVLSLRPDLRVEWSEAR